MLHDGNEGKALLYGSLNAALMFVGVILDRRAFVVFGALGVNGYIGHLAWDVFSQSPLFPFVLSAFGICVIVLRSDLRAEMHGLARCFPRPSSPDDDPSRAGRGPLQLALQSQRAKRRRRGPEIETNLARHKRDNCSFEDREGHQAPFTLPRDTSFIFEGNGGKVALCGCSAS